MEYIFYSLALFAFMWELKSLYEPGKIIAFTNGLKGRKFDDFTSSEKTCALLMFAYFVWTFIGLFTSQWFSFLAIIIISFIPNRKIILLKILDAIITIAILIFIVLNKYHLHFSFNEIISRIS